MMSEEPEAYILGWIPFLGLDIHLDSHPLIPRVETEWWTETMLEQIAKTAPRNDEFTFLDLCAGSGAIGCAVLKEFHNARVSFGEIDSSHEVTIRKNISVNRLDAARAEIFIGDLFGPFGEKTFDYIATNPPYVPEGRTLPKSVEDYEPALALRAGPDGFLFIRRIAKELSQHLAKDGIAWIECDAEHADAAAALFQDEGLHARVCLDQYGRQRFIMVSFRNMVSQRTPDSDSSLD